jgi:hypothetical protein
VRRLLPAGALQQLLAVAPDARAAALAWRLVESLQGLSPTQSLCYDLLGKLAAGELQPHLDLGAGEPSVVAIGCLLKEGAVWCNYVDVAARLH